jgi:ABC transporter substrate binding protein
MNRREFIAGLEGAAWPLAARAQQQPAMPVVALVSGASADAFAGSLAGSLAAFRKALGETGYAEGQNVTVDYYSLEGQFDRLPALMADLVRRRVAVIVASGTAVAVAAEAATATIPIVFGVGEDPVRLGLVASLARPGGNATGYNLFVGEVVGKRLGLLHALLPKAVRIAVLVNPANAAVTEFTLRRVQEAASTIGLQIQTLSASTTGEIDEATEGHVAVDSCEPELGGRSLTLRPFDEQRLFGEPCFTLLRGNAHAHAGKARLQRLVRAFTPSDGAPGVLGQLERQCFDTEAPWFWIALAYRTHFNG